MARRATKTATTTRKPVASKAKPKAPVVAADPEVFKDTADSEGPLPKVVKVSEPESSDVETGEPEMKKRELIDLVVARSGVKKKDAKPAIEAALAILGETIAEGRELNLQPLGKLRINRTEDKGNGRIIICKLRQSLVSQNVIQSDEKEPLAAAMEEL
ncbi:MULTISPECIES: HU family DNA-binding protein [Roseobacteraceae]|nr:MULTISPECIES: HU family DNA-binding protein [Roseobacteraceae]